MVGKERVPVLYISTSVWCSAHPNSGPNMPFQCFLCKKAVFWGIKPSTRILVQTFKKIIIVSSRIAKCIMEIVSNKGEVKCVII